MALTHATWTTTPTNFVSDLKTKILVSTDWANPSGNIVQATTTRGANLAIDLAGAAATAYKATFTVFRSGTSTDPITRYLNYTGAGNSTSAVLRCTMTAWKEGIVLNVEGPRPGETGADSATYGSIANTFALVDLVPYHAGDTEETVVCVSQASSTNGTGQELNVWVGRDAAATRVWEDARLLSVSAPSTLIKWQPYSALDDKVYLWPYLVVENRDGLRGRLADVFFAGWSGGETIQPGDYQTALSPWQEITYDSKTWLLVPAYKTYSTSPMSGPFGRVTNSTSSAGAWLTPLIAIRKT
jgi:hypothetical protein